MDEKRRKKISKYLSKHLRHSPQRIGLQLAAGGWVSVDDLLEACAKNHFEVTRDQLDEVVANNDKQRFAFDDTRTKIRANQGHSIDVDLELKEVEPPDVLFHGTGHRNVDAILRQGLNKMNRHHVHMSADTETAVNVGKRHGKPVVFCVAAQSMHADGFTFYRSDNGVWLVESVPIVYLEVMENH